MNKSGYFLRVTAQTPTRFWINNVTRKEAELAIEAGAVGCTQNPSYTWKMLDNPEEAEYARKLLDKTIEESDDDNRVQIILQRKLVSGVAEKFKPLYEKSRGKYGYVSIQGDPNREQVEVIIENARFNRQAGGNIMAKVPCTEDGLKAMKVLIAERVPINVTEVFAVRQALDVCEIHDKIAKNIDDPAPIYFSHITGIYDEYLKKYAKTQKIDISPDTLWQGGMAVARKVYKTVRERGYIVGFIGGGARDLHHFTEMVGADACITINWMGTADKLIELDPPVVSRFYNPVSDHVIDELMEKLPDFKRGYLESGITPPEYEEFGPVALFRDSFVSAWSKALEVIGKRRKQLNQ
jgi:transaldolase